MKGRTRLTPLGAILLILLALSIIAVFAGSHGLQAAGFIVGVLVLLVIIGDQLPRMRIMAGRGLTAMPRLRPPREDDSRNSGSSDSPR